MVSSRHRGNGGDGIGGRRIPLIHPLHQLQPVAEGVADIAAPVTGQVVIRFDGKTCRIEPTGECTEISPENASKAVQGAQIVGTGNDLALKLDYNTKVAGAYPLVLVTYEIACEKGLPAEQATFVKSFLTYISSPEGQQSLTSQGYAPLPDNIATKVRETVKGLS